MNILIWIISLILTPLLLFIYIYRLFQVTGKNRSADKLLGAFIFVLILGFILHLVLYSFMISVNGMSEVSNLISLVWFSLQSSLEMFIAKTPIFKGEVMEILKLHPLLFHLYIPIYGIAVITSGFAVFHIVSRWFFNRRWLKNNMHEASCIKTHIFIGDNPASRILARNIHTSSPEERIIFIDLPDSHDTPHGLTIFDIIARFFQDSIETEDLNQYIVLKASRGLEGLVHWLDVETNNIYILSDHQDSNLAILETYWKCRKLRKARNESEFKCRIYCHAKKEGLISRYAKLADIQDKIHFVDSSFLAVEYLKKQDSMTMMLPVNYADVAEEDGVRLGYVKSGFNCAVIGFGETGKEAMKFLYEFGAFPDREFGKAQFKCHIFDNQLEMLTGDLDYDLDTLKAPSAKEKEFELHKSKIGTYAFQSEMMHLIHDMNYIVICLGDDNLNMETAIQIAEWAEIKGRKPESRLCIAVKQSNISTLNMDTLINANRSFRNRIHPFGMMEDIWKMEVITNEYMDSAARNFFESYRNMSGGGGDTWEERDAKSRSDSYEERCSARRKIAQDYSNCMHVNTKRFLCEGAGLKANMILDTNDGEIHWNGPYNPTLIYMAVGEHLRWEASHLMLGHKPSDSIKSDVMKFHDCLKPYISLRTDIQHYDWLVVKNSL